jgi:hypothetical protein
MTSLQSVSRRILQHSSRDVKKAGGDMSWIYKNGLSLVVFAIFLVLLFAQSLVGMAEYNDELQRKGAATLSYLSYLGSGHFHEATSENWESEFLQMGFYVLLTVVLRQQGSAESKPLKGEEPVDKIPAEDEVPADAPYPVRRGGWLLAIYQHSLSIAFLALFVMSFAWHVWGGFQLENDERRLDGLPALSLGEYFSSAQFWFESLQNWQSEFLAVGAIVVLSIWLRQLGSPQSKPVAAAHSQTGEG